MSLKTIASNLRKANATKQAKQKERGVVMLTLNERDRQTLRVMAAEGGTTMSGLVHSWVLSRIERWQEQKGATKVR